MNEPAVDFNKQPDGAEISKESLEEIDLRAQMNTITPASTAFERGMSLREEAANPRSYEMSPNEFDKHIHVEFYMCPADGLDHIKFEFPGDEFQKPDYIVDDRYIARFPEKWAAYKKGQGQTTGTMLAECEWVSREQLTELSRHSISTLEQLAGVADAFVGRISHGNRLKERAISQLEDTKSNEKIEPLEAMILELKKKTEEQDALIASLMKPSRGKRKVPVQASA